MVAPKEYTWQLMLLAQHRVSCLHALSHRQCLTQHLTCNNAHSQPVVLTTCMVLTTCTGKSWTSELLPCSARKALRAPRASRDTSATLKSASCVHILLNIASS